jgi:hypothetical protein
MYARLSDKYNMRLSEFFCKKKRKIIGYFTSQLVNPHQCEKLNTDGVRVALLMSCNFCHFSIHKLYDDHNSFVYILQNVIFFANSS